MNESPSTTPDEFSRVLESVRSVEAEQITDDSAARSDLLRLSKKMTALLEGPVNRATDLVFKPYMSIAARVAVDLNLFQYISSVSGTVNSQELASITGADASLLSRMLRLLASADFVDEYAEDVWKANDTTRAMASPAIAAGHRFVYDALITSAIKAPKFLRETEYKVPTEPRNTFLQYAHQTKLSLFEYLQADPLLLQDFNLFMGHTMGSRKYWHEWYDIEDVGGGKGHDLNALDAAFSKAHGSYRGELVLQDLPHVIEDITDNDLAPTISKMAYNFFTGQPVKGARGYFLHHILHDWSDKYCLLILQNLHKAMTPGYSKLLIHELILPNTGATETQARYDLVMMTLGGGMERSKTQWTILLQDAGFCNITFYEHFDNDGIIEAEVPEMIATSVD